MKSNKLIVTALIAGGMLSGAPLIAQPKAVDVQSAWKAYALPKATNYSVFFNPSGQGVSLPILWGFDTAWNSRDNMLRGVRFFPAVGGDNREGSASSVAAEES